jgi:hypothetical protein
MPEHVHVHTPHELNEGNEAETRRERTLEIVAAFLLALTTLAIAWSGYQAARWSGLQAERYTQASAARSLANRAEVDADEERLEDLLTFNRWLEATSAGNDDIAALYERRFSDELRTAFAAWIMLDPLRDPNAPPSPQDVPEYVIADAEESERLEELGDLRFEQGKEATENADKYVFSTVFFAAVLFFSGISLRFQWVRLRIVMLGLAVVFLTYGLVQLATMPTH